MQAELALLLDLDGTLCESQPAFTKWHTMARQHLSDRLGLEYKEVATVFDGLWKEGNRLYYVNPERLIEHACNGLAVAYRGLTDRDLKVLREMFLAVYDQPVTLYPDAEVTMSAFTERGLELGIVTHASQEWTDRKMEWTGVGKFLMKNRPYVVSASGPKDFRSWLSGAGYYEVDITRTWGVGDNLTADANACRQAGLARSFWLNRPDEKVWTIIRDGIPDEGVETINQLSDLLKFL